MACPPKMRGCRRGCLHRERVQDYYRERDAQLDRAEAATLQYGTEEQMFFDRHDGQERRVLFKDWLIATTNEKEE